MYEPMQNTNYAQDPYTRNRMYTKQFLKKPLILILAILTSIGAICSIVNIVLILTNEYLSHVYSTANYISFLLGLAMTILGACAFWIIYAKSRNPSPLASPNAGLTILSVLSIVLIVLVIFLAVMLLIALIAFSGSDILEDSLGWYFGGGAVVVLILILIVTLVLCLLFFIGAARFTGSLRKNSTNVLMQTGGSMLFGVMAIIASIVFLISLISSFSDYTVVAIISQIVTLLTNIFYAVVAFSYHQYAKAINVQLPEYMNAPQGGYSPPRQPVYPQNYADPSFTSPNPMYQQPYPNQYQGYYQQPQQPTYQNPYNQAPQQPYPGYPQQQPPAAGYGVGSAYPFTQPPVPNSTENTAAPDIPAPPIPSQDPAVAPAPEDSNPSHPEE